MRERDPTAPGLLADYGARAASTRPPLLAVVWQDVAHNRAFPNALQFGHRDNSYLEP